MRSSEPYLLCRDLGLQFGHGHLHHAYTNSSTTTTIPSPISTNRLKVLVGIQTNRLKKFGLFLLFSLGFFCMFAAILRFVLIFNASPPTSISYITKY
jgi:hypothetical protein